MTHGTGLRFMLEADPHPGKDRVAARLYAAHAEQKFLGQLSLTTAEYNALAEQLGQPVIPAGLGDRLLVLPPSPADSFGQRVADDAAHALRGISEHQRQWELAEEWNRLYQPGQTVLWWLNTPAEDGVTGGAEAVTAGKAYQDHGWAMVRLRGLAVPISLEHVRPMPAGIPA